MRRTALLAVAILAQVGHAIDFAPRWAQRGFLPDDALPHELWHVGHGIYRMHVAGNAIEIDVSEELDADQAPRAAAMAKGIAALPRVVLRSLPAVEVSLTGHMDSQGHFSPRPAFQHQRIDLFLNLVPRRFRDDGTSYFRLAATYEEVLLHEVAHLLDTQGGYVSDSEEWKGASRKDGNLHLTAYAETNDREDFAETFTLWLAIRRDETRAVQQLEVDRASVKRKAHHRFAWLDRQLVRAIASVDGILFGEP